MPRKSKQINPFDGGLNNYSDARDIEENELAEAVNVDTSNAGRVRIGQRWISVTPPESFVAPKPGKCLFRYDSDWDDATPPTESDTEFEVALDGANIKRKQATGNVWTTVHALSGSPDVDFYVGDGGLRSSDATFTNDVKFLGVVKSRNFGAGSDTISLQAVDAYIDPPTDGKETRNDSAPDSEAITDGTLYLDLQEESGSKTYFTQFKDSESSIIDGLYTQHGEPDSWTESAATYGRKDSYQDVQYTGNQVISAPSGSGKIMLVSKDSTDDDFVKFKMRLENSAQKDFTDKSFFFQIFVPTQVKANMIDPALKVRVGNDVQDTGTSGNDAWIYHIGQSQINANAWTEIEIEYGKHDEIEGSPSGASIDHFVVEANFNASSVVHSSTGQFSFAVADYAIGESSRGLWNGWYKWFYSWKYDKKQESTTKQLSSGALQLENKIIKANVYLEPHSDGFKIGSSSYSKRITGANLYYVEYDIDGNPLVSDKKLFLEVDFEKGGRKPGDSAYVAFDSSAETNNGYKLSSYMTYFDPPAIDSFETTAGYVEDDKIKKMQFKASTVMNRRAYVGNVKVTDSLGKTSIYEDRVYKSEPNMFDVFTEFSYIDVAINDGDSITDLEHFGDFLLQFKNRTMYLINVTQDIEYLEAAYEHRGVWNASAVCKLPEGVAWVNKYGVFIFNGKEVIDLLGKKIDRNHWESFIGAEPTIGYSPLKQDLIIHSHSDSPQAYKYNLITGSWVRQGVFSASSFNDATCDVTSGNNVINHDANANIVKGLSVTGTGIPSNSKVYRIINSTSFTLSNTPTASNNNTTLAFSGDVEGPYNAYPWTNMITLSDGTLKAYADQGSYLYEFHWKNYNSTMFIKIITKDETLGDPAQRKTLKKVYISYKCPGSSLPTVKYITNNSGEINAKSFNESLTQCSEFQTLGFTPVDAVDANNKYSYQVMISGTSDNGFVLNDINLVYRDKTLK